MTRPAAHPGGPELGVDDLAAAVLGHGMPVTYQLPVPLLRVLLGWKELAYRQLGNPEAAALLARAAIALDAAVPAPRGFAARGRPGAGGLGLAVELAREARAAAGPHPPDAPKPG